MALAVFLAWVNLWAAQVFFEPAPRLLGTFHVVVEGAQEESGQAFLFNAVTGQRWILDLRRVGAVLKSQPLRIVRPCDKRGEGALPIEVSGVGELLVVATDLGCGLSAVAKVEPREGTTELSLEVEEEGKWEKTTVLGAGKYRLRVISYPADRSCDLDSLSLTVQTQAEDMKITLDLREDSPNSGVFVWNFTGSFRFDRDVQKLFYVIQGDGETPEVPAVCTALVFSAGGRDLVAKIHLLPVQVEPVMALLVPIGCRAKLKVVEPADPDEVLWWVAGRGWFSGPLLEVIADEPPPSWPPMYPETCLIKIFVREGEAWGMSQIAVSLVPKPELCFVHAESGEKISAPWPVNRDFKLRVSNLVVFRGEELVVHVGKLGPHPNEKAVKLKLVSEGVYESEPLSPRAWQGQTGDTLWAQIEYPGFPACVFHVLIRLQ